MINKSKRFIGREKELQELKNKINSEKFEFGIIYGRRRIGKTTLLEQLEKIVKNQNNPIINFSADQRSVQLNLKRLSNEVANCFKSSFTFENYENLFLYLSKKNQKIVIIIDEFSYLIENEPSIASVFQNIIDRYLKNSNVKLILTGSHLKIMKAIDNFQQPLYQRATFKMHLKPFDYNEAALFYPKMNNSDKIRLYSVFGGFPKYLEEIQDQKSVKENIINIILKKFISNEAEIYFILQEEISKTQKYIDVISSISNGATRIEKIREESDIDATGTTANYIKTLIKIEIVDKKICFDEDHKNTKKTLYFVKDQFFRFYFKFIDTNKNTLNLETKELFYQKFIEPYLDEFVSFEFEKICEVFLQKISLQNNFLISQIGSYWGKINILNSKTQKKENKQVEIDIVVRKESLKNISELTFFECKWTNQFDIRVIKELEDKVQLLTDQKPFTSYPEIKLGFFSKNGYDKGMKEQYPNYSFYSVDDLYNLPQIENSNPSITLKTLKELLLDSTPILISYFSQPFTFYWRDLEAVHNVDNQHITAYDHSKIECDLLQQQDDNFFIRFSKKFTYYFAHSYPIYQDRTIFINKFIAIYQHFIPFYKERLSDKKNVIWSQKDPKYEASVYSGIFLPHIQESFYDDFFNHFFWLFQGTKFQELVSSFGSINLQIHYPDQAYTPITINRYLNLNFSFYSKMMDFHIQTQFQYFAIRDFKNIIQPEWFFIPRSDSKISFLSRLHFTLTFDQINSFFNYRPYLNLYLPDDDQFIDDFSIFNEDLFLGLLKLKILGPEKKLIHSLLGLTENQIEIFYNPRQKKLKLSFQKEWF